MYILLTHGSRATKTLYPVTEMEPQPKLYVLESARINDIKLYIMKEKELSDLSIAYLNLG